MRYDKFRRTFLKKAHFCNLLQGGAPARKVIKINGKLQGISNWRKVVAAGVPCQPVPVENQLREEEDAA